MIRLAIVFVIVATLSAAQTPPKKSAPAKTPPPASAPTAVDSVIEMVQSGLPEALIIKTLQREATPHALKPADLIKLHKAGVPEKVINVLMDPSAAPATPAAEVAAPAPAPAAAPVPTQSRPPLATPPAPAATAGDPTALAAKRPGIKRIGVVGSGSESPQVLGTVIELLRGDGSMLDVIPLTNKIQAYRLAEAKQKQCDYIIEMTVEAKKAGTGAAGFFDKVKTLNAESGSLGINQSQAAELDRKSGSAARINQSLGVKPKDKIKFAYKMYASGSAQPVLAKEQDVVAESLAPFLETAVNDLVTKALQ